MHKRQLNHRHYLQQKIKFWTKVVAAFQQSGSSNQILHYFKAEHIRTSLAQCCLGEGKGVVKKSEKIGLFGKNSTIKNRFLFFLNSQHFCRQSGDSYSIYDLCGKARQCLYCLCTALLLGSMYIWTLLNQLNRS